MNNDLLISVLVQSNWLFLAGWVLLLATAFIISFPEKTLPEKNLLAWGPNLVPDLANPLSNLRPALVESHLLAHGRCSPSPLISLSKEVSQRLHLGRNLRSSDERHLGAVSPHHWARY